MSAYDNPTIIQDLYGSKAWAAAAGQVTQAVTKGLDVIKENREKQADIVAAKQKLYTKSYIQAEIKQTELANSNFSLMETEGKPKGLIEQAKNLSEYEMYGGIHQVEDIVDGKVVMVDKDFGVGSIKAMAEVNANLTLDPETRKKYLKLANNQKDNLKNVAKEGAVVMGDQEVVNALLSGDKDSYWFGDNEGEKYTNYLVASSLYNKEVGGGVKTIKKYGRDEVDGKSNSILDVQIQIPKGSTQATVFTDEYIKNNENVSVVGDNIVVSWKRNLTDGSWDGNLAAKSSIKSLDFNTINKENGSIKNGELNKQYRTELTGTKTRGRSQSQKEVLTFVNVKGFLDGVDTQVSARADTLAQMVLTGSPDDKGDVAHELERMGYMGVEYTKLIEGGGTKEDISNIFKGYIQDDMLSHYKLGQERGPDGKFVNQKVNGLAMEERVITQDQIEELEKNGVDITNIKAGQEHYFYVDSSSVEKGSSGKGSSTPTKLTEDQKTKKFITTSIYDNPESLDVGYTIPGTGGMILKYENGMYQYYKKAQYGVDKVGAAFDQATAEKRFPK